jgi:hypothetical protein
LLLVGTILLPLTFPAAAAARHPFAFWRRPTWTNPSPHQHAADEASSTPSGAYFYPEHVTGLHPWYGGRVGVPSYNWGHFGARPGPTCVRHTGYYGHYVQWSFRRGY